MARQDDIYTRSKQAYEERKKKRQEEEKTTVSDDLFDRSRQAYVDRRNAREANRRDYLAREEALTQPAAAVQTPEPTGFNRYFGRGNLLQQSVQQAKASTPNAQMDAAFEDYRRKMAIYDEMEASARRNRDQDLMNYARGRAYEAYTGAQGEYNKYYDAKSGGWLRSSGTLEGLQKQSEQADREELYANLFGNDEQKRYATGRAQNARDIYNRDLKEDHPAEYYARTMSATDIMAKRGAIADRLTELGGVNSRDGGWVMADNQWGEYYDEAAIDAKAKEFNQLKAEYDIYDAAYARASARNDLSALQRLTEKAKAGDVSAKAAKGREIYTKQGDISFAGDGVINTVLDFFPTASQAAERGMNTAFHGENAKPKWMSDGEAMIYFALLSESADEANEYRRIVQAKHQSEEYARLEDWSSQNLGTGAAGFAASIPLNLASGLSPYTEGGQALNLYGAALRSGNAKYLNELAGTRPDDAVLFAGKGLGDVANIGASVIESWILAQVAGGVGKAMSAAGATEAQVASAMKATSFAGTMVLGGSAAAADYRECLQRGMSDNQAKTHSVLAGLNEAAFEHISLDKLIEVGSVAEIAAKSATRREFFKGMLKAWAVQAGIEASEEGFTTMANRAADLLQAEFSHGNSQYRQRILDYIADGMDSVEARKKVDREYATEIMYDVIGGFLSGGLGAAGQYVGPSISMAKSAIRDAKLGQLGQVAQQDRNAQWGMQAAEKLGKAGYDYRSSGQEIAETVRKAEGGEAALTQYAKDNSIKDRGTKAFARTATEAVNHMADSMATENSLEKAQSQYNAIVEQYGEGIKPAAQKALTKATERIATRTSTNVTQTVDGYRETIKAVEDADVRNAMQEGLNAAVNRQTISAAMQGDTGEFNRGDAYLRAKRTSRTYDLEVTVKGEDGAERTVEVAGISEDGKQVKLSDGTTVDVDSLAADADTKNMLQHIIGANVGGFANLIFQTYLTEVGNKSVTDGYRWLSDFLSAFDRGRQGVVKLEDVLKTVELDHATATKAFELGQRAAEDIVQRGEKDAGLDKITKKGATGRIGSVTLAEGLTNKRLREIRKSKYMAGFGLQLKAIRYIAEALGIDVVLHDSKIEGDKYTGWSGKFEYGKIHLDINGNRSFVNDMGAGILAVTGHELTHWLQTYAPRQYAAYKVAVLQALSDEHGVGWMDRMIGLKQQNHFDKHNEQMSSHEAEDEIVSDASERRMGDEEFWAAIGDQLGEDRQGVKATISKWVKNWLAKLREGIGMAPALPAATRAMDQVANDIDRSLAAMYAGLVKTATENFRAVQAGVEQSGATPQMAEEAYVRESDRIDEETLKFLDNQEHVTVYRAMQLVDGKLYPPMAAKTYAKEDLGEDGKPRKGARRKWVNETKLGQWYQSEERPELIDPNTGKWKLDKGNQSAIDAAYNPYFHTSATPLNDQFSSAYKRPNLVVVQGLIPKSELTSGYKAQYAKDSVGETKWHSGPVAGQLKGEKSRRVFLSRWFQAQRIVPDAEVAKTIAGILEGENIAIPNNVVTPSLLEALRAQGVAIDETGIERENASHQKKAAKDKGRSKYSDRDTEYLELAKDPEKNAARLQEMVDERAREAGAMTLPGGKRKPYYHGTTAKFTSFDISKSDNGTYGYGFYFSPMRSKAEGYGDVRSYYIMTERIATRESHNITPEQVLKIRREYGLVTRENDAEWLTGWLAKTDDMHVMLSLESAITRNTDVQPAEFLQKFREVFGYDGLRQTNETVLFDNRLIKSADPVTYDDSGNVIPLSERFNTENQDIRYSDRENAEWLREQNQAYMNAVAKGDTETARGLVRAAAWRAGYTNEGFHGTMKYGFTVPDTAYSDDRLSFFVASDINTARTYSTVDGVRQVREGGFSADEIEQMRDDCLNEVKDAAITLASRISEQAGIQGWADVGGMMNELVKLSEAYEFHEDEDTLFEEVGTYLDNVLWDLYYQTHDTGSEQPWEDVDDYQIWMESEEMEHVSEAYNSAMNACLGYALAYTAEATKGNYQFYINPNDLLVVQCNGSRWDLIEGNGGLPKSPDWGGKWTTRSAAEWAVRNGYKGVLFEDLIDDGGRGNKRVRTPCDVYALFEPQSQIKSADPVTIDDNGEVIPLEERFNPKKKDVRWSDREELASDGKEHDIKAGGMVVGVQDGRGHVQFSERTWRETGRDKMKAYLDERVKAGLIDRESADALLAAVEEQYNALDEIVRQQPGKYNTYEEWADAEVVTDVFGNPVFSWLKANGDYGLSGDASLICVKRRTLDAVFDYMIKHDMIQDGKDGLKLAQESIVAINDIIRSHGFETACSTCYIDARRYRAAIVAGNFCDLYNKLVRSMLKGKEGVPINCFNFGGNKSVTPLAGSLDTLSDDEINWDGINAAIEKQYKTWEKKGWKRGDKELTAGTTEYRIAKALQAKPNLRKLALRSDFLSGNGFLELNKTNKDILTLYNVKKGTGGPKATETDIQYLHEALEESFITPERMFRAGGFRMQSFSDYVPRLVFDYVEIMGDLAAKGVPAHMYTKEILCVLQHGLTGTKINMSLIPAMVKDGVAPGLDANGEYLWRDGQTFGSTAYSLSPKLEAHLSRILGYKVKGRLTGAQGFELAKRIQNDPEYGKNNGTIAIGVSEKQIRKMLDDADIRMIIPYHKSGLNHILASMMNIPGFDNYEAYQNTLKWNGKKWTKVSEDYDFKGAVQRHKGDAKAAARDYLAWCKAHDYAPKFSGVAAGGARNSYKSAYDFTKHADWQTGEMTGEAEDNYYKVLADFTCYDSSGEISRQEAVQLKYPGTDSAFGSMRELIEMGLESDAMLQAKQDEEVPKIVADIVREIPKFEAAGRSMKAYAELKESIGMGQFSDREDVEYSDLELMENAAQALTEAGSEDYWNALLKSAPELEGRQSAVQTQIEGVRDQARRTRQAEDDLRRLQRQVEDYAGDNPARLTKRRFTESVLQNFAIPAKNRAEFAELLNRVVDHVLAGNSFTELDARPIFDGLMAAGRVREADDYLSQIREDLRGRTIYVNDSVRKEIGDDWNDWKRRAKNAGITITTSESRDVRTESGTVRQQNPGIDMVYAEMAEQYPGSFTERETSGREQLYDLIETSEQGRLSTRSLEESVSRAEAEDRYAGFLRDIRDLQQRAELEIAARSGNAMALEKAKQDAKAAKDALAEAKRKAGEDVGKWRSKAKHNADLLLSALESKRKDIRDLRTQINKQNEDLLKLGAENRGWEAKAKRNADYMQSLIDSKNRDISALKKDHEKALQKLLQEKADEIDKKEKELAKARDVLAGKMLTPELRLLLSWERAQAAHKAETRKQEQFDRYKENRKAGDLRKRIGNLKDELARRLSRPTDRSWIPAGLAKSLVDVLDAIDNSPRLDSIAADKYANVSERLRAMADAYESIKDDKDVGWEYQVEYDEEIRDQIKALARTTQGRNLRQLTTAELQQVYDSVKQVRDIMRDATKAMSGIQFGSLYDAMQAVADQQQGMRGFNAVSKWQRNKRLRLLDNLSVMRAVEMMSGWDRSAALYQLMQAVEDGVVLADAWVMEYNKAMQALKTGKNEKAYRDALTKKLDYGVTDEDGLPVQMTKLQALQILMTAEREAHNDNLVHLQKGGAKIRDALAIQDGKAAKAQSQDIRVTPQLLQNIRDSLTEWDKAYMQAVRDYFKKEGRAANRVHYLLKHKVLQTEEYYVPYIVDKDYLDTNLDEKGAMTMWVKSPGSTNALQKQSAKPVVIDGMDTVMARHVKEMGDYIGLALPIRDFSKVYNGRLSTGGPNPLPVKATIGKNFDAKGQHLLTQAIIDVQGGSRSASWSTAIAERLNALQSAFVRSALLINPSVTIKQAASYAAAESILSHAALIAGNRPLLTGQDASRSPSLIAQIFAAPEGKTAQRIYSEIDEHTSMHYQRRQGMSQAELANEANRSGKVRRAMNAVGARMEQTTVGHAARKAGEMLNPTTWIQRMDVATTAALWVACKQQAKMDGMSVGSAEYWSHVTELYERCLRETQPMYDGLHRTANQKQHEGLMQYLFPFRTVPIQNHGQIAASYEALQAARQSGDKARTQEAGRFFAKTVWAQTESAVVFALMTFLAAALKRKTKKYRDEDEELDLWSVMKGVGLDVASTWFSDLFPVFGSELWSIGDRIYNKATGKSKYSFDAFSVGAVDMLNSLAESGDKLFADIGKVMRGEDVPLETIGDHSLAMVLKAAKIAGIPADTVKTYWEGMLGNVKDVSEGRFQALNDESWDRTAAVNAGRYLKAWIAGDLEKVDAVEAEMLEDYTAAGKSEEDAAKELKSKLTGAAKTAYTDGTLSEQDAIDFLTETGFYTADDAWQKVQEWADGNVKANFYELLDGGASFDTAAADYLAHGFEEEQLREAAKDHLKDRYDAGEVSEDEAIRLLQGYKGLDENEAWKKVREWNAKKEHADEEDYSYSQYEAIDEAIDANKDIGALVRELTDHGVEEKNVRKHVMDRLVDNYIGGNVTESALRNQLSRYCGIVAKADVDKIVNDANCKKQFGVEYSKLDEEYRAGNVSRTDMKNALLRYGGMSSTDADKKLRWYDLQKTNPKLDITESVCNTWYDGTKDHTQKYGHRTAKAEGMSIAKYVEAKSVLSKVTGTDLDNDGKTDTNSIEKAYIQAISGIGGLTAAQRWALYYEEYSGANWKKIAKPKW